MLRQVYEWRDLQIQLNWIPYRLRHLLSSPVKKIVPFVVKVKKGQEYQSKGKSQLQLVNINSTRVYSYEGEREPATSIEVGFESPRRDLLQEEANEESSHYQLQSMMDKLIDEHYGRRASQPDKLHYDQNDAMEDEAQQGYEGLDPFEDLKNNKPQQNRLQSVMDFQKRQEYYASIYHEQTNAVDDPEGHIYNLFEKEQPEGNKLEDTTIKSLQKLQQCLEGQDSNLLNRIPLADIEKQHRQVQVPIEGTKKINFDMSSQKIDWLDFQQKVPTLEYVQATSYAQAIKRQLFNTAYSRAGGIQGPRQKTKSYKSQQSRKSKHESHEQEDRQLETKEKQKKQLKSKPNRQLELNRCQKVRAGEYSNLTSKLANNLSPHQSALVEEENYLEQLDQDVGRRDQFFREHFRKAFGKRSHIQQASDKQTSNKKVQRPVEYEAIDPKARKQLQKRQCLATKGDQQRQKQTSKKIKAASRALYDRQEEEEFVGTSIPRSLRKEAAEYNLNPPVSQKKESIEEVPHIWSFSDLMSQGSSLTARTGNQGQPSERQNISQPTQNQNNFKQRNSQLPECGHSSGVARNQIWENSEHKAQQSLSKDSEIKGLLSLLKHSQKPQRLSQVKKNQPDGSENWNSQEMQQELQQFLSSHYELPSQSKTQLNEQADPLFQRVYYPIEPTKFQISSKKPSKEQLCQNRGQEQSQEDDIEEQNKCAQFHYQAQRKESLQASGSLSDDLQELKMQILQQLQSSRLQSEKSLANNQTERPLQDYRSHFHPREQAIQRFKHSHQGSVDSRYNCSGSVQRQKQSMSPCKKWAGKMGQNEKKKERGDKNLTRFKTRMNNF